MSEKERITQTAIKFAGLMQANFKLQAHKCQIIRNRKFTIFADQMFLPFTLDSAISFEQLTDNGSACNKAEILLLPEELPAFSFTLKEHAIPLPTDCHQHLTVNLRLVSYYIETREPPEHFASRLSAAFETIEPLQGHAISLY
ncbi:DUF1259 domain-containing protein [Planomicrobium sp. CPCC 101110]|uniref:DUF1259 domain-containing protein n=1 Tax=Planomicrobium sp. CPCC 101110 TaxID=2599619 RepID=UPI0011B71373|nr:DUF1259 domain-containing protein [Planomicrobium sp. CPCC 101110]TWT27899.1 DUF1259 domain-containing protein [Planomicrobium sp. CPCC 101110]